MKVILSRKGSDSGNLNIPSPILPDGTLLSLPIPQNGGRPYNELSYGNETYLDIIDQLGGRNGGGTCHLDPDIRQGIFDAPSGWKPVFGQENAALTHLINQEVGIGDLFLFFGWFRQTERQTDDNLRYVHDAPDLHILYGYLQIGKMVVDMDEIRKNYTWHPHANNGHDNNRLYIPRDKLSWNESLHGYGVFSYNQSLVLTKEGMSRTCWKLPDIPAFCGEPRPTISYSSENSWRTDTEHGNYYRAPSRGQEFVIEEIEAVEDWAKSLIAEAEGQHDR